jgi:cytidylate kinase
MPVKKKTTKYIPGTYAKKRPPTTQLVDQYFREWERKRLKMKEKDALPSEMPPAICFSRKIGVGTMEIADIIAEKINYRIADREILDHMAKNAKLSEETVSFFDERYPGKMIELSKMLFGEKSFIMSDYIRNIVSAVFTFADMGATIFVGRGTHLILPRERVLAVRFICSDEYRIRRLAEVLDYLDMEEVKKILDQIDKEQRDFFKKAFGKKDATPYEFDLVINCDYIKNPNWAAEIVIQAFNKKFGLELNRS